MRRKDECHGMGGLSRQDLLDPCHQLIQLLVLNTPQLHHVNPDQCHPTNREHVSEKLAAGGFHSALFMEVVHFWGSFTTTSLGEILKIIFIN